MGRGGDARRRWWVPFVLPFMGAAAGVVLGAATNAVNGAICPDYFRWVMGWWAGEIWLRAVLQGMFEGGILGGVFGVVVAISFAASTRMYGAFGLAAGALWRSITLVLVCWAGGGWVGMLVPEIWLMGRSGILWYPRPKYGWVGGSIWGGYGGAALGAVFACVWLHVRWARREPVSAFPVLPIPVIPDGAASTSSAAQTDERLS